MQQIKKHRYKKNPKLNKGDKIFKNKRDIFWYNNQKPQKASIECYNKIELLGKNILIKEGFQNIEHTSFVIGERFPFDYIAEKNKERYAIEITGGQRKDQIKNKQKQAKRIENMLRIFNLKIIYIFIKPDLSTYFISNPEDKRKTWYFSDCKPNPFMHSGNVNPWIAFFGKIIIPFNFDNIQQITYDLTLFRIYKIEDGGSIINQKTALPKYQQIKQRNNVYSLKKGQCYSLDFCEKINLPDNIYGQIHPRSSANRMGLLITSGIYDPGFKNRIGAVARPFNNIKIKKFDRIATLLLLWADAASKYNGQFQSEHLN